MQVVIFSLGILCIRCSTHLALLRFRFSIFCFGNVWIENWLDKSDIIDEVVLGIWENPSPVDALRKVDVEIDRQEERRSSIPDLPEYAKQREECDRIISQLEDMRIDLHRESRAVQARQ